MGELSHAADDPHRDLIMAIAVGLMLDGVYSVELEQPTFQDLIDLRWCAREAGRLFGIPVAVHASEPSVVGNSKAIVAMTREDVDAGATGHQSRWEALLRAVDRSHLRPVESDRPPHIGE